MKNLQLLPSTLRNESIVKVSFSYDQELIQTLKSMDGSHAKAQFDKVLIVLYGFSSKLVKPKIQNLTAFSGTLPTIRKS